MLQPLAAWLCAVLLLLAGSVPAAAAQKSGGAWQVVLVAADNAEPVFDNGIEALARWLADQGVPAANIHRLSANNEPGDPSVEPSSVDRIFRRIASLRPHRRGRCLVFITSHGKENEGVWVAQDRNFLAPAALAQVLSGGCARVPTVVVVSACYSGSFATGAMRARNRTILTAARRDRPSFGCQADRTYTFFDECLIEALPHSPTWRAVYADTAACVTRMERQLKALPSEPQAYFGRAVRDLPVP